MYKLSQKLLVVSLIALAPGLAVADEFIDYWKKENAFFAKKLAKPDSMTKQDACDLKLMFLHAGRRSDHSSDYPDAKVGPLRQQYAELRAKAKQSKRFQEGLARCPDAELDYEPGL